MDDLVKYEVLSLIPARGGSKSIPRKNILPFAGHPLIAYSIAAGLAAETVDRVVVSTDDAEIAAVARRYGAETPFLRPAEYAQDDTPDLPVFQHTLNWLAENEGYLPEIVVQLRPTSPLRRVAHIDAAVFRLVEHPEADSVRTVCIPFQNPYKMWRIGPNGYMHPLIQTDYKEPYNMPRQSLPEVYWQTGYVDAAWADTICGTERRLGTFGAPPSSPSGFSSPSRCSSPSMTGERILPLIIDPGEWIDIDSPDDWRRAERLLLEGEISLDDLGFTF